MRIYSSHIPRISKILRSKKLLFCSILLTYVLLCHTDNYLNWLYLKAHEVPFDHYSFDHDYPMDINYSFVFTDDKDKINISQTINPTNFKFIHSPEDICGNLSYLGLILIKSSVSNYHHRSTIRKTWFTELQDHDLRGAFLIGQSETYAMKEINSEAFRFQDIIQYNYIDSYYNNTFKTMAAFEWQKKKCIKNDFKFLIMSDDDYYVNVPNLEKFLRQIISSDNQNFERFITGHVFNGSYPKRFSSDKWFMSLKDYKWSQYPPYPTAGFYIVSKPTADYIAKAMSYVLYIKFDDVFIGIILWKLRIMPLKNNEIFIFDPPLLLSSYLDSVSVHTNGKPELIYKVWNILNVHKKNYTIQMSIPRTIS